MAQGNNGSHADGMVVAKPPAKVPVSKNGINPNFGMNMPMMVSAFDTAMWLKAAA